jgi:hypothetical protein
MQFQKTKIKFLNRSLKLAEINKMEIAHCQIEQSLMKFLYNIVYYHHILLTTARILYLVVRSNDFLLNSCLLPQTFLYILFQNLFRISGGSD